MTTRDWSGAWQGNHNHFYCLTWQLSDCKLNKQCPRIVKYIYMRKGVQGNDLNRKMKLNSKFVLCMCHRVSPRHWWHWSLFGQGFHWSCRSCHIGFLHNFVKLFLDPRLHAANFQIPVFVNALNLRKHCITKKYSVESVHCWEEQGDEQFVFV